MKWWWNDNKYAYRQHPDIIHHNWKVGNAIPKTITRSIGRTSGKTYHLHGGITFATKADGEREAKRLKRLHPSKMFAVMLVAHGRDTGVDPYLKARRKSVKSLGKDVMSHFHKSNMLLPVYCIYSRKVD